MVLELNASGTVIDRYIRGINLIKSDLNGFYLYNAHGDVVQLANSSGTVTKSYIYDAFGVETDPVDTDTNPWRYCGEYYDVETKTVYLRARNYDPVIGRFTQQDPAMDGLNWYTYCGGNPVSLVDPTGESAILVALAVIAGGALLTGGVNLISQLISNGGDFSSINWKSVGASAAAGAVTACMALATGGLSLTFAGTIISGALISTSGYLVYNMVNGTQTTLSGLLWAAEFGAVLSGVTYAVGSSTYGAQGPKNVLAKANYAQKTYSKNFSDKGQNIYSDLTGREIKSVSDLASAIKGGAIKAHDIEV